MPDKCFACKGVYHPATGHRFGNTFTFDVRYCGPCYRYFLAFFKSHTRRKWAGADFYAEAATSIRAGVWSKDSG